MAATHARSFCRPVLLYSSTLSRSMKRHFKQARCHLWPTIQTRSLAHRHHSVNVNSTVGGPHGKPLSALQDAESSASRDSRLGKPRVGFRRQTFRGRHDTPQKSPLSASRTSHSLASTYVCHPQRPRVTRWKNAFLTGAKDGLTIATIVNIFVETAIADTKETSAMLKRHPSLSMKASLIVDAA